MTYMYNAFSTEEESGSDQSKVRYNESWISCYCYNEWIVTNSRVLSCRVGGRRIHLHVCIKSRHCFWCYVPVWCRLNWYIRQNSTVRFNSGSLNHWPDTLLDVVATPYYNVAYLFVLVLLCRRLIWFTSDSSALKFLSEERETRFNQNCPSPKMTNCGFSGTKFSGISSIVRHQVPTTQSSHAHFGIRIQVLGTWETSVLLISRFIASYMVSLRSTLSKRIVI